MSWAEKSRVNLRNEFVQHALLEGSNISELCRRFNISRKTGYKWINRYLSTSETGTADLKDISTRPLRSPTKMPKDTKQRILALRNQYPFWGARKLQKLLLKETAIVPAPSAIHKILKNNGCITSENAKNNHFIRFEHDEPNHLWQMDFKGHFAFESGRCHPLTVLDDHSRFSIKLAAFTNEKAETVKNALIVAFERYGLPDRINVDNGSPWGCLFECARYTTLSKWIIRSGVKVSYSKPRHPQTNGKDERFHKTLKLELLNSNYFKTIKHIQKEFDDWRDTYNYIRPHEGIGMETPASRYKPSYRSYAQKLIDVEYSDDYIIRLGNSKGRISYENRQIFIGVPFANEEIGIRHQAKSKLIDIYFTHQKLGTLDLSKIEKKSAVNLYSKKVIHL